MAPDSANTGSSGYHTDREDPIQFVESPEDDSMKSIVDPQEESSMPDTIDDESVRLLNGKHCKAAGHPNGSIYEERYNV